MSYKLLVQERLSKEVFIENIIIMERLCIVNFIIGPMQTDVTSTPLKIKCKTFFFKLLFTSF